MRIPCFALTLLGIFAASAASHADTVSFGSVPTFTIAPSADQYGLLAGTSTVLGGGTVAQAGTFIEGHSGLLVKDIPISFQDSVTVDGITKVLTFTGDDSVAIAYDLLTIDALGPISFGSTVLNFASSVGGEFGTCCSYSVPITATVTDSAATPEPASLVFLATGMLWAVELGRRKLRQES